MALFLVITSLQPLVLPRHNFGGSSTANTAKRSTLWFLALIAPEENLKIELYLSHLFITPIYSSLNIRKNTFHSRSTEYRSWTRLRSTYTRMNSHICRWSPSFRVAIDWRRNELTWTDSRKQKYNAHAPREYNHSRYFALQARVDSERSDSRP